MSAYLDHAATTPLLPQAQAAMVEELGRVGNASSLHASGRRARRVVEESREALAAVLGCRPSEVVFTSGGTEADNLAVKGLWWARRSEDPSRRRVLASAVEHHAVLDPVQWLADHEGAEVEWLPVDHLGRVDVDHARAAIERDPGSIALVSVMWANNEVGTIQPVTALAALAREHGLPFHTDAVQAVGHLPVDFATSGADALTLSGPQARRAGRHRRARPRPRGGPGPGRPRRRPGARGALGHPGHPRDRRPRGGRGGHRLTGRAPAGLGAGGRAARLAGPAPCWRSSPTPS